MKSHFLLLLSIFMFVSCKTQKDASIAQKSSSFFEVGEGGGFSGLYNQYKIYSSGLVEKYDFDKKEYQSWKQIGKDKAGQFLQTIADLHLYEEEIFMPGNMTEYLIVYDDKQVANKLAWPFGGDSVNVKIYTLYKEAYTLCHSKEKEPTEE